MLETTGCFTPMPLTKWRACVPSKLPAWNPTFPGQSDPRPTPPRSGAHPPTACARVLAGGVRGAVINEWAPVTRAARRFLLGCIVPRHCVPLEGPPSAHKLRPTPFTVKSFLYLIRAFLFPGSRPPPRGSVVS